MPYEVRLIKEPENKGWVPYIQNTFTGSITTEEVVASINVTLNLLDQQTSPIDLVAIFEEGSSMFGAKGIVFQKELIDQLTWHSMLDQIIAVDVNTSIYGSFIKALLQTASNQYALKVTAMPTMAELHAYLDKKYARGDKGAEVAATA